VPKKLFVYASEFSNDFNDAAGFGWQATQEERQFDWATLKHNKDVEIERLNGIYGKLLGNAGCEIFNGRATIADAHTININGKQVTAEKILITVGGWPYVPDFPGSEYAITSNETFHLDYLPEKVIVVGGGYIAVEFAGIYNGLGAETRLVYRGSKLLKSFDHDVSAVITSELEQKGIQLSLETTIEKIEKQNDGTLVATLQDGSSLEADTILYATGRRPLFDGLGLDKVNIELLANGKVKVNEQFQTTEPSIYALGDIIDTEELTPVAAVFCQPNIATVGLTERAASEQYDISIYKSSFSPMRNRLSGNPEKTFMKLIVDNASDKVLGIHMVGGEAGEIVQGLAVALKAGATKAVFDATIGIHPTAAEEFVTMRTGCLLMLQFAFIVLSRRHQ